MVRAILYSLSLCLLSSVSYSSEYQQQYSIGETGVHGGIVTDVTVNEVFLGEEVVQDGDFLEITYSYEYTETVVESVENVSFTTTTNVTPVTTTNLIPTAEYTDTNINLSSNNYGIDGSEFTTGNQLTGGGSRIYTGDMSQENKQSVEYGMTVYSHSSNAYVPSCGNTTSDCRDEWSVTVSMFNDGQLVDTTTHLYTDVDWTGSREYSWTENVAGVDFNSATMELWGIDRGYNSGYFGIGFSDVYTYLTYNVIEEIINRVVSYTEMQSVLTTDVYVYDSIYNPTIEVVDVQVQQITQQELQIEVFTTDDTGSMAVEVFEVEIEAGPVVAEIQEIQEIEVVEVEVAVEEVQEEVQESSEDVEKPLEVASKPTDKKPEPKAEVRKDTNTSKPQSYSIAIDSIKVAMMVNAVSQEFTQYQQATIPDVAFYEPVSLDGGQTVDNPYGIWMTASSDQTWANMVDSQWQK